MCNGSQDLYACGCSFVSFESTCTYIRCKQHKEFKPRLLEKNCDSCHRTKGTAIELTKVSSSNLANGNQAQSEVPPLHTHRDFANHRRVSKPPLSIHGDKTNGLSAGLNNMDEYRAGQVQGGANNHAGPFNIEEDENENNPNPNPIRTPTTISNLGSTIVSLADPFLKQVIIQAKQAAIAETHANKQATIDAMYHRIKHSLSQAGGIRDIDVHGERANVKQWIEDVKSGSATLHDMEMGLYMSGDCQDLGRALHAEKAREDMLQDCMKVLAENL